MAGRTHLQSTFHWPAGQRADWAAMLAAGLGMAVPVLLAGWAGRLPLGLAASVGGLLAGGVPAGRDLGARAAALAKGLAPLVLAAPVAVLIAGRAGWTDAAMVVLAIAAALGGGYSRALAAASIRFVAILVMVVGLAEAAPGRWATLVLMGAGTLWWAVLALGLGGLAGWRGGGAAVALPVAPAISAQPFARWRRSLTRLGGWQCALRLGLCLGTAGVLRACWPAHHFIWIALTVTLLLRRQPQPFAVRTTQRTVGVLLGVAASGLIGVRSPPVLALAGLVGLLGGARPLLRARNYLAYSACTTPLVILLMDAGRPAGGGILLDRLLATLIGATLVMVADLMVTRLLARRG